VSPHFRSNADSVLVPGPVIPILASWGRRHGLTSRIASCTVHGGRRSTSYSGFSVLSKASWLGLLSIHPRRHQGLVPRKLNSNSQRRAQKLMEFALSYDGVETFVDNIDVIDVSAAYHPGLQKTRQAIRAGAARTM
jgi:hypothetical protein